MTAFKYVAVDPDGKKVRAKADAVNVDSLRNELLADVEPWLGEQAWPEK